MQDYKANIINLIETGESQFVEFKLTFQKEVIESIAS